MQRVSSQPAKLKRKYGRHFVAPDGALVSIDGIDMDVTRPWFGQFMCSIGYNDVGFQFGPNGTAENAIAPWAGVELLETYGTSGGTLHIVHAAAFDEQFVKHVSDQDTDPELWMAYWQGMWNDLYTFHTTVDEALSIFGQINLKDSPLGIRVAPRPGRRWDIYELNVEKHIPGLGDLDIKPIAAGASLIPRWSGTKVKGGQLYYQPGYGPDEHSQAPEGDLEEVGDFAAHPGLLFLAGPTAVATIEPPLGARIDSPRRMRQIENLIVEWAAENKR